MENLFMLQNANLDWTATFEVRGDRVKVRRYAGEKKQYEETLDRLDARRLWANYTSIGFTRTM